jgi:RNA polymerase sigma-70 factor (ECF subfamily)
VAPNTSGSIVDTGLLSVEANSGRDALQSNVLALFDACGPILLRYVASFGLSAEETEDVVQDTFLALFRHLSLGRDQTNLRGWLFQVAHNLALKRREGNFRRLSNSAPYDGVTDQPIDPAADPEEQLMHRERGDRLRAVFRALPERERQCLSLRAEGLTYRDIAQALRVSLGAVSKAVSRALTRLTNADGG